MKTNDPMDKNQFAIDSIGPQQLPYYNIPSQPHILLPFLFGFLLLSSPSSVASSSALPLLCLLLLVLLFHEPQ